MSDLGRPIKCMGCGKTGHDVLCFVICRGTKAIAEYDAHDTPDCKAVALDVAREEYRKARAA